MEKVSIDNYFYYKSKDLNYPIKSYSNIRFEELGYESNYPLALISYNSIVGVFDGKINKWIVTSSFYSNTTSKHLNIFKCYFNYIDVPFPITNINNVGKTYNSLANMYCNDFINYEYNWEVKLIKDRCKILLNSFYNNKDLLKLKEDKNIDFLNEIVYGRKK